MKAESNVPQAISIRLASDEDQRVIEQLRSLVGWSTVETGLAAMRDGRSIVYILEVDGRPAASGALVLRVDSAELANGRDRSLISNLIVDPQFQGHGLGTNLLAYLEQQARERGYSSMTIGVDAANVRAHALYGAHGYRPYKDKVETWGPVNYLSKEIGEVSI